MSSLYKVKNELIFKFLPNPFSLKWKQLTRRYQLFFVRSQAKTFFLLIGSCDLITTHHSRDNCSSIFNMVLKWILSFFVFIFCTLGYCIESIVKTFIPRSWRAKDISGETVLITGAGSGIGRLLALRFSKLGCKVVLWDINKKGNDETAQMIKNGGGIVHTFVCDLSKREDIYKAAELTKKQVGTVTILVNNAGIVSGKNLLDVPDHMIQKTFEVNALAHFWTVKSFLRDMIDQRKGHIVNIASLAGLMGAPQLTDYCASKFAAVGFDESLNLELRSQGLHQDIKTTVICPFFITTGMFDGFQSDVLPSLKPEDVADTIIAGVLANERMVLIPRYTGISLAIKNFFPWKACCIAGELFGMDNFMKNFKGRQELKQS